MAFTDLVNAVVKAFITPLIAAIFRGVSFEVTVVSAPATLLSCARAAAPLAP